MSRKVWQGDVLFFIRQNIPRSRNKDFLDLYESLNNGVPLAPARISEILNAVKNGKTGNLGRDEFVEKEEIFYDRFFANKDPDTICYKLETFIEEEGLDFPNAVRLPDETEKEYILRFLKYGLANTKVPEPDDGLTEVSSDQAITVLGGGVLTEPGEAIPGAEGVQPDSIRVTPGLETAISGSNDAPGKARGQNTDSAISAINNEQALSQKIQLFIHRNWLTLAWGGGLALCLFLYMSSTGTSIVDVFLRLFTLPVPLFLVLIMLLAALPRICSVLEAFLANTKSQNETGNAENHVNAAIPGSVNLKYGLVSNMLSALCTAAFYIYSNKVEGLVDFIRSHPLNGCLAVLALVSLSITMIWDFLLQMRPVPKSPDEIAENPYHYLLNKPHVLAIMTHQAFTMFFDGTLLIYLGWFGFVNRHLGLSLDISFIGIIGAVFLYLLVASVSPYAKDLKVDCYWLIHMTPLMSLLTLVYAIWFCKWSGVTVLSILANIICLLVWLYHPNDNVKRVIGIILGIGIICAIITTILINKNIIHTAPADFPSDAYPYKGHHYYIYEDAVDIYDAQRKCERNGGYLAVINDKEENEALYNYMVSLDFDLAYFGLVRSFDSEWYYISNGKDPAYTDWGKNTNGQQEPNFDNDDEYNCALDSHMEDGHWNDCKFGKQIYTPEPTSEKYNSKTAYICEWDS